MAVFSLEVRSGYATRTHDKVRAPWKYPLLSANKKVSFVLRTKETFLSDAFLAERDAHCVRDVASLVMHAFGACAERIASLITAQRHHLSLVLQRVFYII